MLRLDGNKGLSFSENYPDFSHLAFTLTETGRAILEAKHDLWEMEPQEALAGRRPTSSSEPALALGRRTAGIGRVDQRGLVPLKIVLVVVLVLEQKPRTRTRNHFIHRGAAWRT